MEYLYKLNLPPLMEILLDGVYDGIFKGTDIPYYRRFDANKLVKPQWLNFNGINWDYVLFFYKPRGFQGELHIDYKKDWGINWIYQGSGNIEFWNPSDVTLSSQEKTLHAGYRTICVPNEKPMKDYKTDPGAYLINASIPHRASAVSDRYAFSLRSSTEKNFEWPELVQKFQKFIY